MDSKDFKKIFGEVAKHQGFERAFNGWFKESSECIVVLDLQKSNYGNYYQLMIKIYVQGMFGSVYNKSKDLIKNTGDIFRGEPPEFKDGLNLDKSMEENIRKQKIEELFNEFITPFSNNSLNRKGLKELAKQEKIYLLPAVKQQLEM